MISLRRVGGQPASLPLVADDIVEFHAARLVLLLSVCGVSGRIDGLTKMAKLDFFARYPRFFEVARVATEHERAADGSSRRRSDEVEAAMVRHHYGPWDKRYYHVLASLEATGLIAVQKDGKTYRIALTRGGRERAKALAARPSFRSLLDRMREIKKAFGARSGNSLKDLIYSLFETEVGSRPIGAVIKQ